MKHRKRTAWMMAPVLLVGLAGGVAWGQQDEGRRGDGPRMGRADRGAQHGGRHWHGHGHGGRRQGRNPAQGFQHMREQLELTDEQVRKIKDVLTEARKKRIALRADARIAGIELRQMVSGETVDKAAVDARVDAIARIRGDLMRARTDALLAVREILTPEQIAKADGMLTRLLHGRKGRGRR